MDYINNRALGRVRFSAAGTCGQYLPVAVDPSGSTYAAGYADGVVRILKHSAINAGQVNFSLLFAFKPHSQPITSLSVSPCGRFIITGAEDTNLFFFQILPRGSQANAADIVQNASVDYSIRPLGFVGLSGVPVAVNWTTLDSDRSSSNDLNSKTRRKFMVVLRSGALYEATTPSVEDLDTETSYQLHARELSLREFHFDVNDDIARAEALGEAACKALAEEEAKKEEELRGDSEPAPAIVLDKSQWKIVFARKGGVGAGLNVVAVLLFDRDHCLVSLEAENGEGQLRVCNIANPKVSRYVDSRGWILLGELIPHIGAFLKSDLPRSNAHHLSAPFALGQVLDLWHAKRWCLLPNILACSILYSIQLDTRSSGLYSSQGYSSFSSKRLQCRTNARVGPVLEVPRARL